MTYFSCEHDAEVLAWQHFSKAREIINRPGASSKWQTEAALRELQLAHELYTFKLDVLERDPGKYDPNY